MALLTLPDKVKTIRPAVEGDIPRLVALGEDFAATVYAGRLTVDPNALARLMAYLLTNGAIFVAEHDGAVVGGIGLVVVPHLMDGRLHGSELFWYVDPAHRGVGLRLLKAAEVWAREQGATRLFMIAPDPAVAVLYERLGYTHLETTYTRSL